MYGHIFRYLEQDQLLKCYWVIKLMDNGYLSTLDGVLGSCLAVILPWASLGLTWILLFLLQWVSFVILIFIGYACTCTHAHTLYSAMNGYWSPFTAKPLQQYGFDKVAVNSHFITNAVMHMMTELPFSLSLCNTIMGQTSKWCLPEKWLTGNGEHDMATLIYRSRNQWWLYSIISKLAVILLGFYYCLITSFFMKTFAWLK